jgi:hypothetical protein
MTERYTRYLARFLFALPVLSLALGALAWLRFGMDIPWYDDWRGYYDGNIGSFDLNYLFRATNDTLAPVGFALDAVAQYFLGGNSVPYQLLSMLFVLGSLLTLQWKLLHKSLGNTFQAAACFSLTVLMVQPGSYWGLENLAYHQALPLVFILSALWLIVCADDTRGWHWVALPFLGLLAGFTYISGAFGVLTTGVTLLLFARTCHRGAARRLMMRRAGLFSAAGAITTALQFYFSVWKVHGTGTHAGIPLVWPNEPQFWMFYLGKIGRSLLLSSDNPKSSLAFAVLACIAAAGIALAVFRRAQGVDATAQDKRVAGIYLSLFAMVFVYLLLVAAGRTNYRDRAIDQLLEIFSYGFIRFHFFWATLLWPWAAAAIVSLSRRVLAQRPVVQWGGIVLVLVLAARMAESGAYDHNKAHREMAAGRLRVAHCLLAELQKGGEIRCPALLPPYFTTLVPDAYPAYVNARNMGASFVRYFPILPRQAP